VISRGEVWGEQVKGGPYSQGSMAFCAAPPRPAVPDHHRAP
jgi:hypothetical protein